MSPGPPTELGASSRVVSNPIRALIPLPASGERVQEDPHSLLEGEGSGEGGEAQARRDPLQLGLVQSTRWLGGRADQADGAA
jgi:hypothetical protein